MGWSLKRFWKNAAIALTAGAAGSYYDKKKEEAKKQAEMSLLQQVDEQNRLAAEEEAIATEANKAEEAERLRIASKYGYAKTIRTTGQGVLGSAPVARKTLLGG